MSKETHTITRNNREISIEYSSEESVKSLEKVKRSSQDETPQKSYATAEESRKK